MIGFKDILGSMNVATVRCCPTLDTQMEDDMATRLARMFTDHPASVDETYFGHMAFAAWFSSPAPATYHTVITTVVEEGVGRGYLVAGRRDLLERVSRTGTDAVFMGGTPVGAPLLGAVSDRFGARWTLIGGGLLTLAGIALAAKAIKPSIRMIGVSMELGAGAVAAGGSLGMLTPPSVVFIVYAIMTEQSIGKLFMAGVLPGPWDATAVAVAGCDLVAGSEDAALDAAGGGWHPQRQSTASSPMSNGVACRMKESSGRSVQFRNCANDRHYD